MCANIYLSLTGGFVFFGSSPHLYNSFFWTLFLHELLKGFSLPPSPLDSLHHWPLSRVSIGPLVCCLSAMGVGGGFMGWWGCHSKPWEEKGRRGCSIRSSPPLLVPSDRTHLTGDLPGRLTTQWVDQRRAFTSSISRLQSLYHKPPQISPQQHPHTLPLFSLYTSPPCLCCAG